MLVYYLLTSKALGGIHVFFSCYEIEKRNINKTEMVQIKEGQSQLGDK